MGHLRYNSMIQSDKPEWLLWLQVEIRGYVSLGMEDTPEAWMDLQDFADACIRRLYNRRDIMVKSEVTADLQTEDGKTQLLIKRNGKTIQVYYIEK